MGNEAVSRDGADVPSSAMRVARLVDALVPPSHRGRASERARARLGIVMIGLGGLVAALFVPLNLEADNASIALLFAIASLASALFIIAFRVCDSVKLPIHGLATVVTGLLVASCVAFGKADVGTLLYFVVLPPALLFLAGARAGLTWLVIGIVVTSAVYAADALDLLPPPTAHNSLVGDFTNILLNFLMAFGFAYLFHRMKEEALREAEGASRAKGDFIATMTHELRTPLNGVIGMANVLVDSEPDDDTPGAAAQRDIARTIRRSGEALLEIIDDILSFERFEAGAVRLHDEVFDPRALVGFVRDMLAVRAAEKDLRLELLVGDDVPPRALGDAGALRQVLLNLVGNAIKFTHGGSVTVRVVRLRGVEPGLRWSVEDTGIGIAPALRERLFSPFTQGDSSTARRYGGTGLGLSICRRFVTAMNGRIDYDSEPGRGSTFWFEVPLRLPVTEDAPAAPTRPAVGAGRRALVVEDNPVNQRVTTHLLGARGIACEVVADGDAALEVLGRGGFDIVFMDCHLPGIDGFETTRRLRSREEGAGLRVPIVAMTASAQPGDREACLRAGMDDYLTKPVTTDELDRVIARFAVPATAASSGASATSTLSATAASAATVAPAVGSDA